MSLSGADPNSLGSGFAALPEPPYWAVIFTAQRSGDDAGYSAMAEAMLALATQQPGYIGVESSRDIKGFGITVSYWADTASILAWKADLRHLAAQKRGHEAWYSHYRLRVAKVERAYAGPQGRQSPQVDQLVMISGPISELGNTAESQGM